MLPQVERFFDLQASAECRSRLIAALLMTMAATVGLT